MDSCMCNFYIGENLHKLEATASPFRNKQEIFVDDRLIVENSGKLVNGYMLYSITVEQVPLVVSIHDCGFGCEFNVFLNDISILDGTRLDARRSEAERITGEGFVGYLKLRFTQYAAKSWPGPLLFILMYSLFAGFSLLACSTVVLAYPLGLLAAAACGYAKQKSIVRRWLEQYQNVSQIPAYTEPKQM